MSDRERGRGRGAKGASTPLVLATWDFEHYFEGTNGATTFANDSAGNRPVTGAGSAALTTTTPLEGVSSLLLNGTLQYATVPNSFIFAPWAAFTLELKIRPTSVTASTFISQSNNTSPNRGWAIVLNANGSLTVNVCGDGTSGAAATTTVTTATGLIVANTTYTIALIRNNSNLTRLFINGVMVASFTAERGSFKSDTPLSIGVLWLTSSSQSTNEFAGRIDAIRYRKGACFIDADSYTVGQAFYEPTAFYHSRITPARTALTSAALQRVIDDIGSATFMYCGVSTMAGLGTNGSISGLRAHAWPQQMSVLLAAELGITINARSIAGTAGRNTTEYAIMNPGISFGSGTVSATTGPGGGMFAHANSAGTPTRLTPGGSAFNTADFYFEDPATGDSIVWGTDGANTSGTINGTNTGLPRKVTVDLGAGATYVEWKSGNSNTIRISIVNPYDASVNQLHVINCGWSGSTTGDWAASKAVAYLTLVDPDLTHSCININDMRISGGNSAAVMVANWQDLHDAAQVAGELVIADTHALDPGDWGNEGTTQAPYFAAFLQEAEDRDIPYVRARPQMGSFADATASLLMFDGAHLTTVGEAIRAQIDAQYYLEVIRAHAA